MFKFGIYCQFTFNNFCFFLLQKNLLLLDVASAHRHRKKKNILSYQDPHHHLYTVSVHTTEERWPSMLFNHHAAFHFDVLSPQIVVFLLIKDRKESEGKEEKHFLNCTLKETRPSVVELV